MRNICHSTFTWYEVGKETPRENIMLFFVTEDDPDAILSGIFKEGQFFLKAPKNTVAHLGADTKVVKFSYQNVAMLPKNASDSINDSGWRDADRELPEHDEPVAIWPSFQGHQFAIWNKHEECWDDESGDDYLCDKDAVSQWFNIPWNGVTNA
jgi:hypothetical protein